MNNKPTTPPHHPPPADGDRPQQRVQGHRRVVYDRRRLIRFDPDRRAGQERRDGVEPWAIP